MPFVLRFSDNDTGAITFTGNTLGLSRSTTTGVPGTLDYIGAFTSTDTSMQFGSYPAGTTADFNLNSASAILRLPAGSSVLYAELVWAGTYRVSGGTNNYIEFIDKSVSLTTPQGTSFSIAPDPITAQTSYRNATYNYFRSANVTTQIQSGGAGSYTVGGVVGNLDLGNSTANNCGWTLCVVYEDPAMPFRNLSLNVGIEEIAAGIPELTTELVGFATPTSGSISGRMALCAQDGDANKTGDQVLFGPTEADLTVLQGPNNFPNNFFASQINDDNGLLDTSGTFGDRNQISGQPGTQIVGGRQSWDITNVDISQTLVNNQSSAVFQLRTGGDGYSVLAVGIYIEINSPRITVSKSVDAEVASVGQILTYTVVIENSGTVPAEASLLFDNLPNNSELIPGSVTINSLPSVNADPVAGVSLGTLTPGDTVVVTYQVRVTSVPPDGVIANNAMVTFEYQSITDGPIFTGDIPSNEVLTPVFAPGLSLTKSVSPTTAAPGQTVSYQLVVVNSGDVQLTNVVVNDPLLGIQEVIPILPVGERTVITSTYTIPAGTRVGTVITNTSTAVSDQTASVSAQAAVTVIPAAVTPSFQLSITKEADRTVTRSGDTIAYRIRVTNTGTARLTAVRVTDALLSLDRLIPALNPNESVVLVAEYGVMGDTPVGTVISNTAQAISNETGPVRAQASVRVTSQPPLNVEKAVFPIVVEPGNMLTFSFTITNMTGTLEVTNIGPTRLNEVTLFDDLPSGARLDAGSVIINNQPEPDADPERGIRLGSLEPGSTVRVSFQVLQASLPNEERAQNQGHVTFVPEGSSETIEVDSNIVIYDVLEEEE
ncbi:hypothetical protein JCM10914A_41970 [Paenibacillus sp. JCM 10914]|uniref:DUF7507 domain-containing protein n=1 Tax=Paenibacillus sp. JCM 10914 TaxID=1236974 RepID=UPI0003CC922E|nr:DUF11 domain-containing protein [Paenibacillus sp. JCM 10914]GAE05413.1 internalin, putative [Paenibacillus sp. JCM 10914]